MSGRTLRSDREIVVKVLSGLVWQRLVLNEPLDAPFMRFALRVVEIVAGALLIPGLVTRLAALALFIDILVAIASTKVPMLLKTGFCDQAGVVRRPETRNRAVVSRSQVKLTFEP